MQKDLIEETPLLFSYGEASSRKLVRIRDENLWSSLAQVFEDYESKFPLCFFPPGFQLETLFHYACRSAKIPSSPGTVYNLNWTVEVMCMIGVDIIVTTPTLVETLLNSYIQKRTENKLHHVVLVGEENQESAEAIRTLFPEVEVQFILNPLDTQHE
jgi:hypothetical protein